MITFCNEKEHINSENIGFPAWVENARWKVSFNVSCRKAAYDHWDCPGGKLLTDLKAAQRKSGCLFD
ncbi:hypothetical protein [Metabacillus fastidiosus]|uniref:hypothetical protein n=1 Tax=Metabacillus fastidiosus TaxID=1458 RepID=UPI003D2686FD